MPTMDRFKTHPIQGSISILKNWTRDRFARLRIDVKGICFETDRYFEIVVDDDKITVCPKPWDEVKQGYKCNRFIERRQGIKTFQMDIHKYDLSEKLISDIQNNFNGIIHFPVTLTTDDVFHLNLNQGDYHG